MRAVVVREYGGPEALELVDVPEPEPGPGQLRIRVAAAAVNPVDPAIVAGYLRDAVTEREHYGLGWDVAGIVDAVGAGVTGFAVGDAVIGLNDRLDVLSGTHAEAVVLDAGAVAPAPAGIDPVHAATLPLNVVTAFQGLDLLDLTAGQTVLVTGAAGGLGGYLVELAALRGLRVVAAAGAEDEKTVRGFGAELFVPRTAHLAETVRELVPGGVDGAADAAVIGGPALDAVRGGGAFVAFIGDGPRSYRGIRVAAIRVWADGRRLAGVAALAEAGRLTTRVAETYPLAEARRAYERLLAGHLRGRLVLVP